MSPRPDKEAAAHQQYEAEHTEPTQPKSVVPYLVILVAAAFLLLLMAYLMQQRTADTVQGLHESVNSIQSIDQLVVENKALRERVETLETQRDDLETKLQAAQERLSQLQSELSIVRQQLTEATAPPEGRPSPAP